MNINRLVAFIGLVLFAGSLVVLGRPELVEVHGDMIVCVVVSIALLGGGMASEIAEG